MSQQISLDQLKNCVGKEVATTDWLIITQERIQLFADATGDHQWIHLDSQRAAKESPYGCTIAHGFLTLSLLSQFMKAALEVPGLRMTINYGLNRVRFPAPVRVNSPVRARFQLQSLKDVEGGFEAAYQATLEVKDTDKPCCAAEWIVRYYPA